MSVIFPHVLGLNLITSKFLKSYLNLTNKWHHSQSLPNVFMGLSPSLTTTPKTSQLLERSLSGLSLEDLEENFDDEDESEEEIIL